MGARKPQSTDCGAACILCPRISLNSALLPLLLQPCLPNFKNYGPRSAVSSQIVLGRPADFPIERRYAIMSSPRRQMGQINKNCPERGKCSHSSYDIQVSWSNSLHYIPSRLRTKDGLWSPKEQEHQLPETGKTSSSYPRHRQNCLRVSTYFRS